VVHAAALNRGHHLYSNSNGQSSRWALAHILVLFGRPFVKRLLSVRCLSMCPSVCNVGVLWPNGLTDQDETWLAGRPRPWPYCVRWGPTSLSPKWAQSPQFSAHICCGQMAAWIKMPLGIELGLGPGDFVLDGDPAPLPKFSSHVYYSDCDFVIECPSSSSSTLCISFLEKKFIRT